MTRVFSQREKIILSITAAVLIFSLAFNFLFLPLFRKNAALNKEIKVSRLKLKRYLYLLEHKEHLNDKYGSLAADLNLSVAGKDILLAALSELEVLAKDANIRIIDLRPENPKARDLYQEIIIALRTQGAMEDLLKFIYLLRQSASALMIKKLQLNAQPNSALLEGEFCLSQVSNLE